MSEHKTTIPQALMFQQAQQAAAQGDSTKALQLCTNLLRQLPRAPHVNHLAGLIYADRGEPGTALKHLERAAQYSPAPGVKLLFDLARVNHENGRFQRAESVLKTGLEHHNRSLDLYLALGLTLNAQQKYKDAAELYTKAIKHWKNEPRLLLAMADCHSKAGNFSEAIQYGLRLAHYHPGNPEHWKALGSYYIRGDHMPEAQEAYQRAQKIAPEDPVPDFELGRAFMLRLMHEKAEAHYQKALDLGSPGAGLNLSNIYKNHGKLEEAKTALETALELSPNHPAHYTTYPELLAHLGQIEAATNLFTEGLSKTQSPADIYKLFLYYLNFDPSTPEHAIAQHYKDWNRLLKGIYPESNLAPNEPLTDRRLRVGYISGDFRRHSVCYFFLPLLQHHDKTRIESFCYSTSVAQDDLTREVQANTEHWRYIVGPTPPQIADTIRADRLDILVDLSGLTEGGLLDVLARRLAPIQINWLGYPHTTGVPAIDYRLTDEITDPPDSDAYHSETLIRLPGGFLCYRPPIKHPAVQAPPLMEHDHVTFGCFNNLLKVNEQVVALWSRLLHETPGSKILLKAKQLNSESMQEKYHSLFEAQGIPKDRVLLYGLIPDPQGHLALYSQVDIALDPFPYNGTTTTFEALWMGVPVLTIRGDSHRARVGASILTHLGLTDLIAETPEAFVEKGKQLAADTAALSQLRENLRPRMQASPMMHEEAFAQKMEDVYFSLVKQKGN